MSDKNKMLDPGGFAPRDSLEAISPREDKDADLLHEWERWNADQTPDNVRPLLRRLQPTISAGLRSYAGKSGDTLRPRAELLAVQAMRTYDPKRGSRLDTHVHNALQGLQRIRQERTSLVHIPENVQVEKRHLAQARTEFENEHGHEPSLAELADMTGVSVRRMAKLEQYKGVGAESQFLNEHGDSMYPVTPGDSQRIWIDYVYNELDPTDQKILEWSTGYGGTKVIRKKDMAVRLKMSAPAVSSRIAKIVRKLEEGMNV